MDMNELTRAEKIEYYLENKLTDEELTVFQDMLQQDQTLQAEVQLSQGLEMMLKGLGEEKKLSQQLTALGQRYFMDEENESLKVVESKVASIPKVKAIPFYKKQWFAAAAAILLLIAGAGILQLWLNTQSASGGDLYAAYYEPYPAYELTRSDSALDVVYQKALLAYEQENYQEAIAPLKDYIARSGDAFPAQIMLGNALLNTKPPETKAAINLFGQLSDPKKTGIFAETAQWYLAMAHLQAGQKVLAKAQLEKLAIKKIGRYPKLAQKMLKELS